MSWGLAPMAKIEVVIDGDQVPAVRDFFIEARDKVPSLVTGLLRLLEDRHGSSSSPSPIRQGVVPWPPDP